MLCYETMEKPVAGSLWLLCLNFHEKCESEDTEVSKADRNALFASNKKQIDIHTLMLDMLHSNNCQLYVPINVEVYLKRFFLVWMLFFFYLCSHKSYQRH